ncbi:MAG: DUF2510 domain-containing protein [Bacteroidetes bacterium]|nr:DUF2510 domain-containing protein [Bacteroidota bacterium]
MKTIKANWFNFLIFLTLSLSLCNLNSFSQGIAINTTGAAPDNSAMLDISTASGPTGSRQGILIPRISLSSNTDVSGFYTPLATSLMVYNDGASGLSPAGFYYWNGSQWTQATGPQGPTGAAGVTGATGLLGSGAATGNTPYWDGSQWVLNNSNIYNAAGNVGIGTSTPGEKLEVVGNIVSKGTLWTSRTSAANNSWQSVTYGNGLFVAVASDGTGNRVMTSPDGINWTIRTSAANNDWYSVTYGNGLFVAVASSGTNNKVMTSTDGIIWTLRTTPSEGIWTSVTYGNGMFVAVGISGTVMTSPDGIIWTSGTSASTNNWRCVTYGNGMFVAVSYDGTGNRVMSSPDGINWTSRSSTADNMWYGVTYGNGLFVAVAWTGSNKVMTSPDGINWTPRTSPDKYWVSVTYGNGLFVAVSWADGTNVNTVMTSPDGINWTSRISAATNDWLFVTYGNGMFVAVTNSGTGNRVMTSGKTDFNIIPANNIYQGGMTINGNVGIGTKTPGTLLDAKIGTSHLRFNNSWNPAGLNTGDQVLEITTDETGHFAKIQSHQYDVGYTTLSLQGDGGNVGIGTTDPGTSKLKVAGTIESSTGGIKFPDGTVQTTAATAAGTTRVFVKSGSYSLSTGFATMIYPTEVLDVSNEYSTSTGIFTATNAGYYNISASTGKQRDGHNNAILKVVKNIGGTPEILFGCIANSYNTGASSSVSGIVYLTAGETICIQMRQSTWAVAVEDNGEGTFPFLSIIQM